MLYQHNTTQYKHTSHNTHTGFINKLCYVTIQVLDAIEHLGHI